MRVLIAANAVRMGGALQHLCGLLPALAADPEQQWLVVTNAATAGALPPLPTSVVVERYESDSLDPLRRLLFEQRLVASRARAFHADVVLSFNSFAVLGAPCPQVVIAANALYVCPQYWDQVATLGVAAWAGERLRSAMLQWSLRRAESVIAPSHWMAEALCERFGLSPERVSVVHHGINPVFFEASASGAHEQAVPRPVILAASRHGISKDFATLVRAASMLLQSGVGVFSVELTGTPSESSYARATAALVVSLGLEAHVAFIGDLSQAELARRHGQADVFVFPSWCESFGLPQVEAAASGMAVIAPELEVSRELLGDAARYYQPRNPHSLVAQIRDLLGDPVAAQALRQRAVDRVRGYTWERAAQGTLAALASAARHEEALAS